LPAIPRIATAHALLALGLAHLEQGREAVEAGRRAVALDPDMAFAHYAHGWALLEHDDSRSVASPWSTDRINDAGGNAGASAKRPGVALEVV